MSDEDLTAALNDIQRCVYELHQAPARMSVRDVVEGVRQLTAERNAARAALTRVTALVDVVDQVATGAPGMLASTDIRRVIEGSGE